MTSIPSTPAGRGTVNEDTWTFPDSVKAPRLVGFSVEALDGFLGGVEATSQGRPDYLIVGTRQSNLGERYVLPCSIVEEVDRHEQIVYVDRTKAEILGAPRYDKTSIEDAEYHARLASYYGVGGPGFRA
jgi:hypothetical protein